MPLFSRSFQELMTDTISDLAQNTNITRLSPGGVARAILEAVNKRLNEAYDVFDLNLARAFVSTAPGQFLDLIGSLLGVSRESSVAAWVDDDAEVVKFYVETGTFGDINNSNDIVIPQGTIISTGPDNAGTLYRVTAEYTLLAAQSTVWVAAEAVVPGEDSNIGSSSLVYHTFTDYSDSDDETLLVKNVHPVANGKNFESDANFRFRIVNRVLEAEAANMTAIRLAILTTPGVADVVLIPRYRGIGTFAAILKAVLPVVTDSLISTVEANVQKVQALGEIAYIRAPKETGASMNITVHYDQRLPTDTLETIEETIRDVVTNHINGLDIGEDFYVNRMVSEIFSVSSHIANLGEAGKPIDEFYIHTESRLQDNKVRQKLLGDYSVDSDERFIIEPSVSVPIVLERAYTRR